MNCEVVQSMTLYELFFDLLRYSTCLRIKYTVSMVSAAIAIYKTSIWRIMRSVYRV